MGELRETGWAFGGIEAGRGLVGVMRMMAIKSHRCS